MTSDWIYYFGYGSLVNRDTRPAGEFAQSAHLTGWHRVWEHRTADKERQQQCTSLSIEPIKLPEGGGIDGVIARIPASMLDELDLRESGYERLSLPISDFELTTNIDSDTIFVYRSLPQNRFLADVKQPILQSYIDCVLAGYQNRFDDVGMRTMIESTRGWDRPILNDRQAPHYPRWVTIDPALQAQIDQHMDALPNTQI